LTIKAPITPEERISLGTLWPAKELDNFYVGHLSARGGVRRLLDKSRAGFGIAVSALEGGDHVEGSSLAGGRGPKN